MKTVLIYSGTTEGRRLAELLAKEKSSVEVCVATEYGQQVMTPSKYISVRQKRLSVEEMRRLVSDNDYEAVVDATHPFATDVTKNIKESIEGLDIAYYRLKRDTSFDEADSLCEGVRYFASAAECSEALCQTEGNILLTTGSKELAVFADRQELHERLFARVLPGLESIELCQKSHIPGSRIIAMQGPFSKETNVALMKQFDIRIMVTKESGTFGGFPEKMQAAGELGVKTFVIGNPEREKGMSLEEVWDALTRGKKVDLGLQREIAIVGIGMGNPNTLTQEAVDAIAKAEVVFGAKRMVETVASKKQCNSHYLPEDIKRDLEELTTTDGGLRPVAILVSGDVGFFSGAEGHYQILHKAGYDNVRMIPGISSMAYLAAAIPMPWQDAKICSLHGKLNGEWEAELVDFISLNPKVFVLFSDKEQVTEMCALLVGRKLSHVKVYIGYQLSYAGERIIGVTAAKWLEMEKEMPRGLYAAFLVNKKTGIKKLTQGIRDNQFLRDAVPMTKEEIREISISKLHLYEGATFLDVGSGTGAISIEVAGLSSGISVYAVEKNPKACALLRENIAKFGRDNIYPVEGMAPEILDVVPIPTHCFIGGTKGRLTEILTRLYEMNPTMYVVINGISLETIQEFIGIEKQFPVRDFSLVQVQVSRAEKAGGYHLMKGENPIAICSFRFCTIQDSI